MKVEFLSGFEKDLSKTRDKKLAKVILDCIHIFENSNNLKDISGIKKLKGHTTAYRYRKGKYRIGFYYEDNTIIFAAFAPRSKIYQVFP